MVSLVEFFVTFKYSFHTSIIIYIMPYLLISLAAQTLHITSQDYHIFLQPFAETDTYLCTQRNMGWSCYESLLGVTPLTPQNCSRIIKNWANTGLKE